MWGTVHVRGSATPPSIPNKQFLDETLTYVSGSAPVAYRSRSN